MTYVAALFVVAPLVAVYAWIVRWVDRYEPEPWWILALCFLWGAFGATLGGGLSTGLAEHVTAATLFDSMGDPEAVSAFSATVYAPLFEEAFKGLGVLAILLFSVLLFHQFDGPLDGVVYGGMVGLGFTLTEDTLYVGAAAEEGGAAAFVAVTVLRTVFTGLGHALFTSMTGLGLGMAVRSRSARAWVLWPAAGFGMAVLLHSAHNVLPSYLGAEGGILSVLLSWVFFLGWFLLLGALVLAERRVVLRQLAGEVGGLVRDRRELDHLATLVARGLSHVGLLFSRGWRVWRATRRRHHALVQLALVKERRFGGDHSARMAHHEGRLRAEIAALARQGAV